MISAKKTRKIVVIGAGSASFCLETLSSILKTETLHGLELALVDINASGLEKIRRLADIVNARWGAEMTITATTDRREALPGADYIVISIAIDREKCWRADNEIALKHGISHYAENGGPGGFIHSARNISAFLGIIDDIKKLCPDAFVLNFTNPMTRICQAIQRLSDIRFVGMCHQLYFGYYILGTVFAKECGVTLKKDLRYRWDDDFMGYHLGLSDTVKPRFDIKAAGLNHFTCMLDVRDQETGNDLLPELRRRFAALPPEFEPLTQAMFKTFDLILVQGDSHIVEYLPYASRLSAGTFEKYEIPMYDFDWGGRKRDEMWVNIEAMISGKLDVDSLKNERSERAENIISALQTNGNSYEETVNIPNHGNIKNLPEGTVVEVPGIVSSGGVTGLSMGELPTVMAELCRRQLLINDLTIEAVVKGDARLVRELIALDPMVSELVTAHALADEYLKANRTYLPTFH
jgi:alpha-galactosidase